jgi:FkbM family methyltransferase
MSLPAKKLLRATTPRHVRNWLRSPGKSAEWLWNEARHLAGGDAVVEMRPGWFVRCHPSAYDFAYYAQIGDAEQVSEFDGFISTCRPAMALFDVGAHFGLFSLAALHFGGAEARAVAVDPSPTAARMMRIQAKLNGVGGRMSIEQASVGDSDGWQEMVATGVNGAGYFLPPGDHAGRELTKTIATTLDGLVERHGVTPTHVKIDVEGAEASVLRGGRRLLAAEQPPLLFLEVHNEIVREHSGDPSETLKLLNRHGYRVFANDMLPLDEDYILSKPLLRVIAKRQA